MQYKMCSNGGSVYDRDTEAAYISYNLVVSMVRGP
jgi:hypothetical protein